MVHLFLISCRTIDGSGYLCNHGIVEGRVHATKYSAEDAMIRILQEIKDNGLRELDAQVGQFALWPVYNRA